MFDHNFKEYEFNDDNNGTYYIKSSSFVLILEFNIKTNDIGVLNVKRCNNLIIDFFYLLFLFL